MMDRKQQFSHQGWGSAHASGGAALNATGQLEQTDDLNVLESITFPSPDRVKADLPMSDRANKVVVESRNTLKQHISGADKRFTAIVGPCSIHDEEIALAYASKLAELRNKVIDRMDIIMRVYFEKPRTTVGWKGLVNDPHLNDSFDMASGITKARRILLRITEMGLPTGTEMLDPITPQYIADLVTWSSIGARTTESQTHRQMASGLSMPVGFKNGTNGDLNVATNAMTSARSTHAFLGLDGEGKIVIIRTRGNDWGHLILRGGSNGPNYTSEYIQEAAEKLKAANLPQSIIVDCSHANSDKQAKNQRKVWHNIIAQRTAGNMHIIGGMLESNLVFGKQSFNPGDDRNKLDYGVSITDECIGWEETEELILDAYEQLG